MTGSTGEVMAQHVYDALEEFNGLESIRATVGKLQLADVSFVALVLNHNITKKTRI